jgi:transposase IS66-like protein
VGSAKRAGGLGERACWPGRARWGRNVAWHDAQATLPETVEPLEPGGRPSTRDEVLAVYRPIRAAIRRVLREAVRTCGRADLARAARQLGLRDDGDAAEMLADVALFEPDQRGRRAFDRFLETGARRLNGVEPLAWLTDVLERMVSGRTKAHELERLLPWTWKAEQAVVAGDARRLWRSDGTCY